MRDEDVRASCFSQLAILAARWGDDVPYEGALDAGFVFRGRRVPYLSRMKGIHRAAVQRGSAALAINTSLRSPYGDEETDDGVRYAYRAGPIDQPDNTALRRACELRVPLVYFVGTRPGWYKPFFPCWVVEDDPVARSVLIVKGRLVGPPDDPEPLLTDDPIERRYATRELRVRVHQARFRGRVLPAYSSRCAICSLKEVRLLDAAHITADASSDGDALVSNGLSLCTIHHRAFDQDLVAITPDYQVRVSPRLLEDDDGPMLDLLKGFHQQPIHVPERRTWRPDRERLAVRFERFLSVA